MDKDSQGRKTRPDYNFFEWGILINDRDGYPVIRLHDSIKIIKALSPLELDVHSRIEAINKARELGLL